MASHVEPQMAHSPSQAKRTAGERVGTGFTPESYRGFSGEETRGFPPVGGA